MYYGFGGVLMPKKDLRKMKNEKMHKKTDKDDIREIAKEANINVGDIDNEDISNLEATISQYENKSEDELMGDLQQMIKNGKEDGSFSNEMLDGFMKNVAPMLNKDQKKRLDEIARMIKMNKI
jgi:hypothetical protein